VLWVRNTVKDTLEAHDRLSGLLGTRNVILFHARFAHCDRLAIEESVLTRFGKDSPADGRRGMVVVATQVAEQSLDLDFDLVLSDLAPMENLLQRSGRCCRHPRDDRPGSVSGPRLVVLSPPLDAEPDKNWFASMSSGSARVYPLQGPLWLAARLLRERGGFRLPEDARELLEAVYGEEAKERVPKALATADLPVEGQLLGAMAWANTNMLKLSSGYKREDTPWAEDERSPTRLGEESVRLRLCRWENGVLSPWHADGDALRRWAMSEMNAPHWMIYDVPPLADSALRLAVDQAVARMPDQRRWAKILPLTPAGDAWHGVGLDEQGGLVNVRYSRTRGLEVVKGGGG
jgi:CRISPR-associated endonuclease/helicase Cas3